MVVFSFTLRNLILILDYELSTVLSVPHCPSPVLAMDNDGMVQMKELSCRNVTEKLGWFWNERGGEIVISLSIMSLGLNTFCMTYVRFMEDGLHPTIGWVN